MKQLVLVLLSFSVLPANAQVGFAEHYELDALSASIHDITIRNDTIILGGTTFIDSLGQWGILLAKMDTNGVILSRNIYYDSLGYSYVRDIGWPVENTSDGGYVFTGLFSGKSGFFLMKINEAGEQEFVREYFDGNVTPFPLEFLETYHHYYIGGFYSDGRPKQFLQKMNKQGEIIFTKVFDIPTHGSAIFSLKEVNENEIVLGAFRRSYPYQSPWSYLEDWIKSRIFAVDSLGSIKWQWEGNINDGGAVRGLHKTEDGGYLYGTGNLHIFEGTGLTGLQSKLFKRDSNFNLIWKKNIGIPSREFSGVFAISPTPDGNWIAAGRWGNFTTEPTYLDIGWAGSCLYKFTENGDSLWSRCDTVALDVFYDEKHGGVVALSSGSIIAAGNVDTYGANARTYGFVVKTDVNGCVDTLCNLVNVLESPESKLNLNLTIYPNPVSDWVTFDWDIPLIRTSDLLIYDNNAQIVFKKKIEKGLSSIDVSVDGLSSGIYFYRLNLEDNQKKQLVGKLVVK